MRKRNSALQMAAAAFCAGVILALALPAGWSLAACAAVLLLSLGLGH
ncbi:MAG: hypothetical protein VB021_06455 [Oscillospiraceae bacterium]|nr:hypothetical protein [Oscillospiraceae bacterium]